MVARATRQRLLQAVNDSEVLEIVRNLVKIPSHWALPEREEPIAVFLRDLFQSEGIDVYLQYAEEGRPNVIATLRGAGGGPSLMFNGHIDTVPPFGMKNPLKAIVEDGKLYGRGATDMKSGVGTMAYAVILLNRLKLKLKGDLIFAGVIDEDAAGSAGTHYLIDYGPKTDFAIVGEPTHLHPVTAHKGIDYFEVKFTGRSAHSSIPGKGINAIFAAAEFVTKIEEELIPRYRHLKHPLVSSPTANVGLMQGYAQANKPYLMGESKAFAGIVPDICHVYLDVRWTPYQTTEEVTRDVKEIAEEVAKIRPDVQIKVLYIPLPRPAMEISPDNVLVKSLEDNIEEVTRMKKPIRGENYWGDSGLLYGLAKIPTVMFGPGDIIYAHSDDEYVDIDQLAPAAKIYALTALNICGIIE